MKGGEYVPPLLEDFQLYIVKIITTNQNPAVFSRGLKVTLIDMPHLAFSRPPPPPPQNVGKGGGNFRSLELNSVMVPPPPKKGEVGDFF